MKKEEAEEAAAGDPAAPRLEAHLPALMQAQKLLERAARVGRGRVPPGGGRSEEVKEGVLGRRLLDLLEEARLAGVDAELALRSACARLARELDSPSRAVSDRSPPPDDRHGPARN
jgi:XTP/dITP diphosphohydrolase